MTDRELLEDILERVKRLEANLLISKESEERRMRALANQMNQQQFQRPYYGGSIGPQAKF